MSGEVGLGVLVLAIKVVLEVLWLGWRALVGDWTPFAILAFVLFAKIAKKKRGSYPKFRAPRDSPRLSHSLSASFTLTAGSRRHRETTPNAFSIRLFVCYSFALSRGAAIYQWTAAQDTRITAPVKAYAAPGGLLAAQQCTDAVIDAVAGCTCPHGAPSAPSRAAATRSNSEARNDSKSVVAHDLHDARRGPPSAASRSIAPTVGDRRPQPFDSRAAIKSSRPSDGRS